MKPERYNMNTILAKSSITDSPHSSDGQTSHAFANRMAGAPAAARTAIKLLDRISYGTIVVSFPNGTSQRFGSGQAPHGAIGLHNWNVFTASIKSGDIGFAESFFAGDWTTPNLTELLKVFIGNRREIEDVIYGTWLGRLAYRIKHLLNRNTKSNSQKNIHAHYDLGNEFYTLWLDRTMNYSSAIFEGDMNRPLPAAQDAKVRRALQLAGVKHGDRVLEIGCGWGALAEMASRDFGATVTGVTLSKEQLDYAIRRVDALELPQRTDLRLQDYRDVKDAPFDAICSIEMVEAVGREYWPTYFETVSRLLVPGGRACVQSIVIRDDLFGRYISSTDFIQQYIFPGGCLPCPKEFRAQAQAAGLEVVDEYSFGLDYAETLRRWRETFMAQRSRIHSLKFDDRFMLIWEFYLAYCEAAFAMANVDVVQYTLRKRGI